MKAKTRAVSIFKTIFLELNLTKYNNLLRKMSLKITSSSYYREIIIIEV